MLKQGLQQKLSQRLNPLQIQLVKLLELPTFKLEQRIKEEIEKNPVLEEGQDSLTNDSEDSQEVDNDADISIDDYLDNDDTPAYKYSSGNYSSEIKPEIPISTSLTCIENLQSQLHLRNISEDERFLAEYLIGTLDEDGYLRRDLDAIVDDIVLTQGKDVSTEEIERALKLIQTFEPIGVGARDLRECLLIQLKRRLKDNFSAERDFARKIIKYDFEEFTLKHYDKIRKRYKMTEDELRGSIDEILKLNPKPGGVIDPLAAKGVDKIIPDFTLDLIDGELQLSLNSRNLPELRVNRSYVEMLSSFQKKGENVNRQDKDAIAFVKFKLNSARSFIDAIRQRQQTLMLTMTAIIQHQEEFFMTGDNYKLKPMKLKDIAEMTNFDISTISRVSNSKYIQTYFGLFSLKEFFSNGIQNEKGEDISSSSIKDALQEIIDNEDKKKPLTDDELVDILKSKNYKIARRTVAKYRGQLHIPVARLRKEL